MPEHNRNIFHLAIPCRDLDEAKRFYVDKLGIEAARTYEDRVTFDFFGHQVVCYLAPDKIDRESEIYPRHFGITVHERSVFEGLVAQMKQAGLDFLKPPFVRFGGMPEEHVTFFLKDPSNNVIEFKHYNDESMMY